MNNKIIILWGIIIFGLVISIYTIGISKSDNFRYKELKENLELSINKYLDDYDLWPADSMSITSDELIENDYLNELFYEGSKCSANVIVTNTDGKYKYEYDINCVYE